jgi:putative N-acetyltransferase (TIGR04045 family)
VVGKGQGIKDKNLSFILRFFTPPPFILHPSSLIPYPSSFILHPSSLIPHPLSFMPPSPYLFKLAKTAPEIAAYFDLRRSIFVEEQGLFQTSDVDELDAIAYPIIALANNDEDKFDDSENQNSLNPRLSAFSLQPSALSHPLGVVRIYEPEPGLWYGGRLGVHQDYRRAGRIGKGLIYKAVTTANTWGCERFLATVQLQNVRFFQRQHWNSLEEMMICGLPHHLMEADLNHYPPGNEQRPVIPTPVWEAS